MKSCKTKRMTNVLHNMGGVRRTEYTSLLCGLAKRAGGPRSVVVNVTVDGSWRG